MCYDYSKLAGRIVEKFGTQYNFAIAMGLSERTISLKMNGKVSWKDTETNFIHLYFFKEKVHVCEQR